MKPEIRSIFLLQDPSSEVNGNLPSYFNFLWIQPTSAAETQSCSPELLRNTLEIGMLKIASVLFDPVVVYVVPG